MGVFLDSSQWDSLRLVVDAGAPDQAGNPLLGGAVIGLSGVDLSGRRLPTLSAPKGMSA